MAVRRDGQMVGMRPIDHTTPEELVSLIVGRKAREINRPVLLAGPEILRVENLATPLVGPVSFRIAQGEMLGLAGLRGAGHEDIGRSLIGTIAHRGTITLEGRNPDLCTPQSAMQSGIGFVARDRMHESIAPGLSIRENAYINPSATGRGLMSFLRPRTEGRLAAATGARVGLAPNEPTLTIEALSGGNQQKVVVGRNDPDGGRVDRPDRRLWYCFMAYSGDFLANHLWAALACDCSNRSGIGRNCWCDERLSG